MSKQNKTQQKVKKDCISFNTDPTPEVIFLEMENNSTKDVINKFKPSAVLIPLMSTIPDNTPDGRIPPFGSAINKDFSDDDFDIPTYHIQCITRNTIYDFINVEAFITSMRNIIKNYSKFVSEYRKVTPLESPEESDKHIHLILVNADEFASLSDSLSASAAISRLIEDYWTPVQELYPFDMLQVVFTFNQNNIDEDDAIFSIRMKEKKKKKNKKKKSKK